MMESMVTLGYWSAVVGVVLCMVGYFAFPAMIRLLDTTGEDE